MFRKIIYGFGIACFLAGLTFFVITTSTNPLFGMSEAALAQTSSSQSSGGSGIQCVDCASWEICNPNTGECENAEDDDVSTMTYLFNAAKYDVDEPDVYEIQTTTTSPYYEFGGSFSASAGVVSGSGDITYHVGSTSTQETRTYNDPVICDPNGYQECYTNGSGKTIFK